MRGVGRGVRRADCGGVNQRTETRGGGGEDGKLANYCLRKLTSPRVAVCAALRRPSILSEDEVTHENLHSI
jgi:hypothetical protein